MELTEKLRKMLKKNQDALRLVEEEDDLVDDCKYIVYYTDQYTDGDVVGSGWAVKSLREAKRYIENSLYKVGA